MRRWILALFICLLPMQWALASAGSVCGHARDCSAHFGHHEHKHKHGYDHERAAPAVDDGSVTSHSLPGDSHPDCQTCHAMGVAVARSADAAVPTPETDAPAPRSAAAWPDPPVDDLLRPPAPALV